MCGIVCVFDLKTEPQLIRPQILDMSKKVRHRGPDWSGMYYGEKVLMAHERLAIVDPISGGQPLYSSDKNLVLAVNGEIYNHLLLRTELKNPYAFQTESDCEIILALYNEKGTEFMEDLNGIFAFALYDKSDNSYPIARDHIVLARGTQLSTLRLLGQGAARRQPARVPTASATATAAAKAEPSPTSSGAALLRADSIETVRAACGNPAMMAALPDAQKAELGALGLCNPS